MNHNVENVVSRYVDLGDREVVVTLVGWKGVHYIRAECGGSSVSKATLEGEMVAKRMVEDMAQRHMWRKTKDKEL